MMPEVKMWSDPENPGSGVVFQVHPPSSSWREARIVFDEPEPELKVTEQLDEGGHKVWIIDGVPFGLDASAEGYDRSAERMEDLAKAHLRRARRKRKAAELRRELDAKEQREKLAEEQARILNDAREALLALRLLVPSAVVVPVLDAIDSVDPKAGR